MVCHPEHKWYSKAQFGLTTHLPAKSFHEPVTTPNKAASDLSVNLGFVIYRAIMVAAIIFVWVSAIYKNLAYSGIYLTVWSLTLILFHFIYQLGLLTYRYISKGKTLTWDVRLLESSHDDSPIDKKSPNGTSLPLAEKLGWTLATVASHASLTVTFVYWVALYPALSDSVRNDTDKWKMATDYYMPHILNFVFMLIDSMIAKIPFRAHHSAFTAIYFIIYGAFYVIYWAVGGTDANGGPIYVILDLSAKPGLAAAVTVLTLLLTPIWGLFFHAVSYFKQRCLMKTGA